MIAQSWIRTNNGYLAAVESIPKVIKSGAILFSGFSQSMCDSDYFMSRLVRRLNQNDVYTLQVDVRGHGDSSGRLQEISIAELIKDIESVINIYSMKEIGNLYCIGRGLSAVLLASLSSQSDLNIQGIVGINPYCLQGIFVRDLWSELYNQDSIIEIRNLLVNDLSKDKYTAFFGALGADVENLLGQSISSRFLKDLEALVPSEKLKSCCQNYLYLIPEISKENKYGFSEWDPNSHNPFQQLDLRRKIYFPINAMWQHQVIEKIVDFFNGKVYE